MYKTIMTPELESQLGRKVPLNIIDVRDEWEYESGHIDGAINIPLGELNRHYTNLSKEITYHIICLTGHRSQEASRFLADKGYHVVNVMGGMSIYKGAMSQ
ncbi:rhodanese-like domain-containing protein [Erysipelothrix sp. strain 2 (EsS2-6-Brazil)]|uniref:rhodanese-like domain-containing protein n=1 Tax=Erysipelothrix sp. strain 2 (EsS2-6-Brazil) TaxID=2500549 RepID=UPI00190B7A80|nr:rhodanese-like domain-containing protein [Erysipelothrix sp. strain 2 (EsS2-6-Brazil)]MBK2402667.1 rhodanese-like domain-containing protein [Erysipelothrix sp. strain 2 (EsS2-6-Brazil)]